MVIIESDRQVTVSNRRMLDDIPAVEIGEVRTMVAVHKGGRVVVIIAGRVVVVGDVRVVVVDKGRIAMTNTGRADVIHGGSSAKKLRATAGIQRGTLVAGDPEAQDSRGRATITVLRGNSGNVRAALPATLVYAN